MWSEKIVGERAQAAESLKLEFVEDIFFSFREERLKRRPLKRIPVWRIERTAPSSPSHHKDKSAAARKTNSPVQLLGPV
ncbi:hypothetical protein EVAR_86371_1 [Eumeta japonica]|uniref:Uncharacterized protein n=1 Tax=Eumeta variegata TaxID=151549 RepID=A0A4C1WBC5_EUMVA|nr:hypothetical protein EVAR_86371_1 [Eumeta japonica]